MKVDFKAGLFQIPIFRGLGGSSMKKCKLTDICTPKQWKTIPTSELMDSGYPVYGANGVIGYYRDYNHEKPTVTITCRGATCGNINLTIPQSYVTGNAMCLDNVDENVVVKYLYYAMQAFNFTKVISGSAQPQITRENLQKVEICVYSIEKQSMIVNHLEAVERLIHNRKMQLEKLYELVQSRFVEMFGDTKINNKRWKTTKLLNILEKGSSVSYGIVQTGDDIEGGVPVFRPIDIAGGHIPKISELKRTDKEISDKYKRTLLKGYELLITVRGSVGETFQTNVEFAGCNVGRNIVPLRFDTDKVLYKYMENYFSQSGTKDILASMTKGIALQGLNMSEFREIAIIIPPIELQKEFVRFAETIDKSKLSVLLLWKNHGYYLVI